MPTTTDISSFTPQQQAAFKSAAALSNGNAQYTTTPPPPPVTPPAPVNTPTPPQTPTPTQTPGTPAPTPADTKTVGPSDAQGNALLQDQPDRQALAQAQADYQTQAKQVSDTITNIQNGTTPLSAGEQAQIDGLKQQFQVLVDQQNLTNKGANGTAQMRGYQGGAAEYDPTFQAKTIGAVVSAGQAKVADLQIKEASAVAELTQSLKDHDVKAAQDAWSVYQDAAKSRQDALQKTIDDTQAAIKDAQDQAQKAQDRKIAADKVIYDQQQQAKQDQYNQVTKPIQDIQSTLAKAGAPQDVIKAAGSAQTVDEALAAGGQYLQASSNPDIAQYLFYKQQASASGQEPVSYDEYQKQQNALADSQAYSKAYATASGSAAGTASATPTIDTNSPGTGLGGTSGGQSILAAAGISIAAFNYLTQGTASMSRMTAAQRAQIMNEAESWLNKKGIDVSTFQSQYKAYNDVLQQNVQRANNVKIRAGEVAGSADSLLNVLATDATTPSSVSTIFGNFNVSGKNTLDPNASKLGNLTSANVLDLMAGKQVNSAFAQKYSFQINAMANDLAGYFAAAKGSNTPDDSDRRDAANVISNGMNSTSVQAFKDSLKANEEKVTGVVSKGVTDTQKQVWDLFGVGDKYVSPVNTNDVLLQDGNQQATQTLDSLMGGQASPFPQLDSLSSQYGI